MRTQISAVVLAGLVSVSSGVQADVIGAKIGATYWFTADQGNVETLNLQFEHPLPFLPNLAVSGFSADDSNTEISARDFWLYYEILDNDLVSLDLGGGLRQYNNSRILSQSFDGYTPMLIADIELLPDADDLSAYIRGSIGKKDGDFIDLSAAVGFHILPLTTITAGYRYNKIELDGFDGLVEDETIKGGFIGIQLDF
ncbi:hypothetical protein [Pelagibaculum spongiae]|uniref:TIGR04219 family outer membrane beta-barrel protein n=1 Tax=Pelagibaculum spongiae TaxID=2080658 RepID=A0A2V1GVL0_9GAMM|nr:hypothetical protein [Pelagibaculum spongiae]PVZ64379.1 hypothetical protein DC094_20190 [Pelagibaculum spongiae]